MPKKKSAKKPIAKKKPAKKASQLKTTHVTAPPPKKKRGRPKQETSIAKKASTMVPADALSAAAKGLIVKVDMAELRLLDLQDALQQVLVKLTEELGSCSFEHPQRGPMSVMHRNERYFWRAKPVGPGKAA